MPFNLNKLIRPHLIHLQPYSSARDEFKGIADVYLDANENPYGSVGASAKYNRYPDPLQPKLKEKIAELKACDSSQIFLGNGSDEPIDLLLRVFCEPEKDNIILLPPTYGMYQVSADINHVKVVNVPLSSDFQIQKQKVLDAIVPETKVIFFCSPNNPSGNSLKREDIIEITNFFDGLVVVDEAYIDFSSQKTFVADLKNYPNLVVLQTFSKAWGLAGIRLGMAFASPEIISILNKVKYPYNINTLTQQVALKALQKNEIKNKMVSKIIKQRNVLTEHLLNNQLVEKIYPTDANFILVKTPKGKEIYDSLVEKGIIVRDRSKVQLCEGCLRITVGTEMENLALLRAWSELKI
ncbi:MAG TPA: histidinol-phosphate transaminase [Cytophagales bacterium]|nr:histidinol-phosphate transaminase [Cytophagales bacterium]